MGLAVFAVEVFGVFLDGESVGLERTVVVEPGPGPGGGRLALRTGGSVATKEVGRGRLCRGRRPAGVA